MKVYHFNYVEKVSIRMASILFSLLLLFDDITHTQNELDGESTGTDAVPNSSTVPLE